MNLNRPVREIYAKQTQRRFFWNEKLPIARATYAHVIAKNETLLSIEKTN